MGSKPPNIFEKNEKENVKPVTIEIKVWLFKTKTGAEKRFNRINRLEYLSDGKTFVHDDWRYHPKLEKAPSHYAPYKYTVTTSRSVSDSKRGRPRKRK